MPNGKRSNKKFPPTFQVVFASPVSIAAHPKINEWLTLVEKEMRVTLAKLLASAVKDNYEFKAGKIEPSQYLVWVDKYQVLQLLCLRLSYLFP